MVSSSPRKLMRTLLCPEPGRLEMVDRPRPEPRPGHVRVRIACVGICGTDYHIHGGNQPFLSYPRVMGHELSGYALDASEDGRVAAGDLVVVRPYLSCGACRACERGRPNCCERIVVLGVHLDGGMCEEIAVPEGNLTPANDLGEDAAAMVEFLAIGAHGVRRAGIGPGDRALVVGAGPIGLGAALFAAIAGAEITLGDTSADRLDLAGGVVPAATLRDMGGEPTGERYDAVLDATGSLIAMNAGLAHVGHGGAYVLLSLVKGAFSFDDTEFHKRETTLLASRNALAADFDHVMNSMRAGLVPVDRLATHETTLEGAVEDLPRWAQDRGRVVKALVRV